MRSRAELYDWELAHVAGRRFQDLAFYSELKARTGGPVLELACGTGRLTVPLSAVGLDIDEGMLAVARARGARLLLRADMRRFALRATFGLVAIAYNSIQLLGSDDERVRCLRRAAHHLVPGGLIGLEITDFQDGALVPAVEPATLASAEGVTLVAGLSHDFARRVTTYHRRFEENGRVLVDDVRLRCLDQAELEALVARAGLLLTEVAELNSAPPRLTCVAAVSS